MPIRTKKVQGLRKKSKKPYSGVPIRSGLRAILSGHGFWLILAEFGNADFHRTSSLPGLILTDFTKISQNQPVFRSTPTQKTKFATEKWNSPNSVSRLNSITCFGLSKFSGIQLNFSTEFG
jgi:hypothetical protein